MKHWWNRGWWLRMIHQTFVWYLTWRNPHLLYIKVVWHKNTCPPNSLIWFSTYIFGTRNFWRMMVEFLLAPSMMNHTKSNFIVVLWVISLEKLWLDDFCWKDLNVLFLFDDIYLYSYISIYVNIHINLLFNDIWWHRSHKTLAVLDKFYRSKFEKPEVFGHNLQETHPTPVSPHPNTCHSTKLKT